MKTSGPRLFRAMHETRRFQIITAFINTKLTQLSQSYSLSSRKFRGLCGPYWDLKYEYWQFERRRIINDQTLNRCTCRTGLPPITMSSTPNWNEATDL